jgi:transcriptional regulator with XRE-family HTH domain
MDAGTPSDWRGYRNLLGALRRAGFDDPARIPLRARRRRAEWASPEIDMEKGMNMNPMTTNGHIEAGASPTITEEPRGATAQLQWWTILREERSAAKSSRKTVAEIVGVSSATVANWERGKGPTTTSWVKLCDLFPRLRESQPPQSERRRRTEHLPRATSRGTGELRHVLRVLAILRTARWRRDLIVLLEEAESAALSIAEVLALLK